MKKRVRNSYDLELVVPVHCENNHLHNVTIDFHRLLANAPDHTTALARYDSLEGLGASVPQCFYACKSFNLLAEQFRRHPRKFWAMFDNWIGSGKRVGMAPDMQRVVNDRILTWLPADHAFVTKPDPFNFLGFMVEVHRRFDLLRRRYQILW